MPEHQAGVALSDTTKRKNELPGQRESATEHTLYMQEAQAHEGNVYGCQSTKSDF